MNDIKVIIAEDDRQIAEIQKRFIERITGFKLVGIAHEIKETEDLFEIFKPDLILLDIQFPSGTGLELLRKLRSQKNNVDIILITASKEVSTLKEALRGGVFDYILKPLVFERLQETLLNYKKQILQFEKIESIDQYDVDTALPRINNNYQHSNKNTRLPKGIDALTLEKIRSVFKETKGSMSAEEVGELIGASRTTARRYLEHLISINELSAEVSYGSVGRPERKYNFNANK